MLTFLVCQNIRGYNLRGFTRYGADVFITGDQNFMICAGIDTQNPYSFESEI
jgi:hypothetical protein